MRSRRIPSVHIAVPNQCLLRTVVRSETDRKYLNYNLRVPADAVGLIVCSAAGIPGSGCERDRANGTANSGGGIAAGVQLEVADHRNHRVTSGCGALAGAERRMTAHCLIAFAFASLGGGPCWMGLKEDNRAFLCIRHDRHSSQYHPQKLQQCGYRIVIPECPPNPETKPPVKVRIGREFANVIRCHCRAAVRAGTTAIRTIATGTDRIPV